MLHKLINLLSEDEKFFLKNVSDNFETYDVDRPNGNESKNSYNRVYLKGDELKNYYKNLEKFKK